MFFKLDHIGIVVHDLQGAAMRLSELIGESFDQGSVLNLPGLKVAPISVGDIELELIQFDEPVQGVDPVAVGRQKGLQHIAFQVEDLDKAIGLLAKKGVRILHGFPREGAHGRIAFINPDDMAGILVELCQENR